MNKHNDKIMQKAKLNLKGLFDLLGKACCGILLSIVTLNTFAQAGIKVTFYHNDILGSPVAATDENGNLLWRQQYRPYGSKPDDESSPQGNRIDYTGHRIDNDLGLVYAGARYYDPEIGRFMSTDPMGFQMASVHSFNKYAYANNNPYRYRDPDGNIPVETVWDIANVVMGVASFGANLASGNFVGAAWDFGGIVVDLAATVTPYVPGGAGTALKAKRAADALGDVAKGVTVSKSRFPESAQHIEDAVAAGKPNTLTIDRANAGARRRDSLRGTETRSGLDRDEFPPAMFQEGGQSASVRHINPGDNRGAGACIGAQCRGLPDGTRVRIDVVD